MKKILVPVDFSKFSEYALKVALEIAKVADAEVLALHVMLAPKDTQITADEDGIFIHGTGDNFLENSVKGIRNNLKNLLVGYKYDKLNYKISSGEISPAIMDCIEKENIDFIVMGTQGEGNYDHFLLGSNAEKMVRFAPCPVLTIRSEIQSASFKKITFAANLRSSSDQSRVTEEIKKLKAMFGAEIHLVYVNTPTDFSTNRELEKDAKAFQEKYDLTDAHFQVYCDMAEGDGVLHFSEENNMDLIVMVTHQRTGFARLFSGSISEEVVSSSKIPVLTYSLNA